MLCIRDLHASIDGKTILAGVDLDLPAGEVHAVMGPNGAGKSTLSNVLAGRDGYAVKGTVILDGVDLLATSCAPRSTPSVGREARARSAPSTSWPWRVSTWLRSTSSRAS
jgi:Fe-S cluster assembly ATP-binding protein